MKRKTTLDFDELNELDKLKQLEKKVKSAKKSKMPLAIPYREYFGAMYIEPEDMHNRIELAEQIERVMLYVFAYWFIVASEEQAVDELRQEAKDRLTAVVAKHTVVDSYLQNHINNVVDEVIDATARHTKKNQPPDDEEDYEEEQYTRQELDEIKAITESDDEDTEEDYWTSENRAMLISEDEANAIYNYDDYRQAVRSGKTKKVWVTENDEKVRMTHTLVEGKTVDIDGLFLVGESLMRFPKDTMYQASPTETVNCRCTCHYK